LGASIGRTSTSDLLAESTFLVPTDTLQLIEGENHQALVWVGEGGDSMTIDALGQGVGELGSPGALLRPFPPLHEALHHQLGQM